MPPVTKVRIPARCATSLPVIARQHKGHCSSKTKCWSMTLHGAGYGCGAIFSHGRCPCKVPPEGGGVKRCKAGSTAGLCITSSISVHRCFSQVPPFDLFQRRHEPTRGGIAMTLQHGMFSCDGKEESQCGTHSAIDNSNGSWCGFMISDGFFHLQSRFHILRKWHSCMAWGHS